MIVAQQFTAGMRSGRIVVREADGWNRSRQIDVLFSRPLSADRAEILFVQSQ